MSRRSERFAGQRGAALLVVLWSAVALAGLATVVAGTARTDIAVARNQVAEAQARHLAQGAVTLGALRLLAGTEGGDPVVLGQTTVSVGQQEATVRFRDECGKVDLNTAWGDLLRELVEDHAALTDTDIRAAAVLDWRDPDSILAPGGAETPDYAAAGRGHGARNGPFDSIAELQQLLGATPAFVQSIREDVTVDCLNAGIDPIVASPRVLAAIPRLGTEARARFLGERRAFVEAGATGPEPRLAGGGRYVEASPGLAVEIEAVGHGAPEGVRWRAVVWLTGDGARPILFRTWERAGP